MANIHAEAAELEKAADKKKKQAEEDRARRDAIGEETRTSGPMTSTGNMRRYVLRRNDMPYAAAALRSSLDAGLVFFATQMNSKPLFGTLQELWLSLNRSLHLSTSNRDPARYVDMRDYEDTSYVFHTAVIGSAIKQKLDQEIAEVRAVEQRCQTHYAAGQYGPFAEHRQIAKLKEAFDMRTHPLTGDIAFSESRIRTLQSEMHCRDHSCSIVVFAPVSTASLRGIHVKAADPNSQDAVKITTSDKAVDAAAAPVRVQPPQLQYTPD